MCGIAGIINMSGASCDVVQLKAMSERLNLRGPDDKGEYVDGNVGFAHRRLSIIDVKSGHQPMTIDNGNLAIVYNGEVYNFNELRSEMNAKRGG